MSKINYNGPDVFKPLSPWAYFGLSILFSLPVVGFIFLIIFSVSDANINRRNFARSYWCIYVIIAVAAVVAVASGVTLGSRKYDGGGSSDSLTNCAVFGTAIKIDNKSDCFCSRFLYVIEFLKTKVSLYRQ